MNEHGEKLHEVVYYQNLETLGKCKMKQQVTQQQLAKLLLCSDIQIISIDKPPAAYHRRKKGRKK